MNEKQAADYLDLPVEIVTALVEGGLLRADGSSSKPFRSDDEKAFTKKSVENPTPNGTTVEYFFTKDDLEAFKKLQEGRTDGANEIIVVSVSADRFARGEGKEAKQVELIFRGGEYTEADAEREAIRQSSKGGLSLAQGWRNHTPNSFAFFVKESGVDDGDKA